MVQEIECICGEDFVEPGEEWCLLCLGNLRLYGWCLGTLVQMRNEANEEANTEYWDRLVVSQGTAPIEPFSKAKRPKVWRPRREDMRDVPT